jgi:hypothetical protein
LESGSDDAHENGCEDCRISAGMNDLAGFEFESEHGLVEGFVICRAPVDCKLEQAWRGEKYVAMKDEEIERSVSSEDDEVGRVGIIRAQQIPA